MNQNDSQDIADDPFVPLLGHRWIRLAGALGVLFVVVHLVTVIVTCTVEGFNWGFNAWFLDAGGFLAGFFFAIQCWLSSSRSAREFSSGNRWIAIWASVTVVFRVVDTLMLFGILKWDTIYVTPAGVVLWSNVISEVVVGMAFAATALVGSVSLLLVAHGASE
ncbi:MAG: hypothetical protein NXI32_30905 [bacterium]|nr:hypothetical protein [bacterium]